MLRFWDDCLASAALGNWPIAFLAVVWIGLLIRGGELFILVPALLI